MQVIIEIHNTRSSVVGSSEALSVVNEALSYIVPGADHIQRNLKYNWDGKVRLMRKNGAFPTGLVRTAARALMGAGYKLHITDKRVRPKKKHNFDFKLPFSPRCYQTKAVSLSDTHARGVYRLATGAGKSLVIAMLTAKIGVDTLIIVPDLGLKEQLYDDFRRWFPKIVSKDIKSKAPIIITNVDNLINKDKKLFERFSLLVVDEFHNSASKTYIKVNDLACNAYYRYGLTGTFVRTDGTEMNMYGVLSNVIYDKSASDLIEEGFLCPAKIFIHQIKIAGHSRKRWRDAYTAIAVGEEFNRLVVFLAEKEIAKEKQTLILVRLKAHGELLKLKLRDKAVYLSGDDDVAYRDQQKALFIAGKIRCLISTNILGEGQNIPNIDVLINARLQKSEIQTYQGIGRALRKSEGKLFATVHDFSVRGNNAIYEHSLERIALYRAERAFQIILS
jgi:superfamily II DNA or RNA helicase